MRGRYLALAVLALGAGLGAGIWIERERASLAMGEAESGPQILYWVAPMDPNFRKDGPGKSPMGMELVPVYEGEQPTSDPQLVQLSAAEVNAIGVRTAIAQVEALSRRVETVGFVGLDEYATSHLHTRVEGWIERLAVRALGDEVAEGDLLFELYAPEITLASSELMMATRRAATDEIALARTKLLNFGVDPRQIDEMAQADAPTQRIRYYAPQDGVVIGLEAADGMYLRPETRAMSLADLSRVWLLVDVFERDMGRLTPDMTAEARFDHLPGQVFTGAIDYIFPQLDPETRTLRVRLAFDNAEGLLKPNMFARVRLIPTQTREALTVPSEAVIRTGRAERVILRTADGAFRPRLVTTGLRDAFGTGGRTEILQGLKPGEEVVASAQFLIDSESALNAGMTRFAPTETRPVTAKGDFLAFDPDKRRIRIRHDAIEALDWPAMETDFTLRADVAVAHEPGDRVAFAIVRGADGVLALSDLGPDDGIDASGRGIVHAVTPDGKLTISHDPIPALGWPAMRMDLDAVGVDLDAVPLETPVEFDLAEGEGGLFRIVQLRSVDAAAAPDETAATAEPSPASDSDAPLDSGPGPDPETPAPMLVSGRIEAIDAVARTARIAHGPIREIGMPGMTMDFPLGPELDPDSLPIGEETGLLLEQGSDLSLTLVGTAALQP